MTIRQWRESPGGSKETLNRRLRKQPEGVWSPEGLRTGFSSEDFLGFSLQQHGRGEKSIKEISNTKYGYGNRLGRHEGTFLVFSRKN